MELITDSAGRQTAKTSNPDRKEPPREEEEAERKSYQGERGTEDSCTESAVLLLSF